MLQVWAPRGVGEIHVGDDLTSVFLTALGTTGRLLRDGDIVLVTSKVVSKAEGRARASTRDQELPGETMRVVATRGQTRIVRNRLGLTMAAAGIDASNVTEGTVLLLPEDPDGTARTIRSELYARTGTNVAVLITDTAGRAWRDGQTDIAIGAAGLTVLETFAGQVDAYGNPLVVTAPAVADELAGAAELAQGKLRARPFAVVSGREDLLRSVGDDGPGAAALIRPEGSDLFGYGAREAVLRALRSEPAEQAPFGQPSDPAELISALAEIGLECREPASLGDPGDRGREVGDGVGETTSVIVPGPLAPTDRARLGALVFAFGWRVAGDDDAGARLLPRTP